MLLSRWFGGCRCGWTWSGGGTLTVVGRFIRCIVWDLSGSLTLSASLASLWLACRTTGKIHSELVFLCSARVVGLVLLLLFVSCWQCCHGVGVDAVVVDVDTTDV